MNVFMYRDADSLIHKLDPRTKLLVMLTFFVYALIFHNALIQVIIFLFVLLYAAIGRSLVNVFRAKTILLSIFTITTIMWLVTMRGATKIIFWLSMEGLLYGVSSGLTLVIIIITSIVFISTTKIEELTLGCMKLGLPYRAAFAVSTAIRMIPTIAGTATTILQAQKSRGLDVDSGSFIQKLKKYVPLMIPTIVSVIRGTTVFAMALESKGFGYSDKRVEYITITYKTIDYVASVILLLLICLAAFIKFYFHL